MIQPAGTCNKWPYEHDVHGFVHVARNDRGTYEPDPVQRQAVADSIAFFGQAMK